MAASRNKRPPLMQLMKNWGNRGTEQDNGRWRGTSAALQSPENQGSWPLFLSSGRVWGSAGMGKGRPPPRRHWKRGKELRQTGPSEDPWQVLPSAASRLPRSSPPTHTHTAAPSSDLRHPPRYLLGCRRSPKQQQQQRTRARPSSQPPHRSRLAERAASRDSLGSPAPSLPRPRALVRQRDRIGRPGRGAKEAQDVGGEETEAARGAARRRRTTTTPLLPPAEKKAALGREAVLSELRGLPWL